MTIREALREGASLLRRGGIENPHRDAGIFLGEILKTDKTHLALQDEKQIDCACYTEYQEMLKRRAEGECAAYITGHKEFRFLDLLVDKNVLVPRPDTEILVEAALCAIDSMKGQITVIDLCTGSGAVALALKYERPSLAISASDISDAALLVAKQNAQKYQLQNDIAFIESDLFCAIKNQFDIIVSNPPYIPHNALSELAIEVKNEPALALDGGTEGLEIIRRVINGAREHLNKNGFLFLEAAPAQMPRIAELLEDAAFAEITVTNDLSGAQRVIGGRLADSHQ